MQNSCCDHRNFDSVNRLDTESADWQSFTAKKRTSCSGLLKTALNNVVLSTLFNVVNDVIQYCLRARKFSILYSLVQTFACLFVQRILRYGPLFQSLTYLYCSFFKLEIMAVMEFLWVFLWYMIFFVKPGLRLVVIVLVKSFSRS